MILRLDLRVRIQGCHRVYKKGHVFGTKSRNSNEPLNANEIITNDHMRVHDLFRLIRIKRDKNTVDGSEEISEAFNDYFINIGPKLAAESTSNSSNNVHKYLNCKTNIN